MATDTPDQNESLKQSSQPINSPSQPTVMDVHKPHGGHHKKKFIDYFFEFFMLFLAVTMGFFVENKREDYNDDKKEKEYIHSLIQDLREDTFKLTSEINRNWLLMRGIDSLTDAIYKYTNRGNVFMTSLDSVFNTNPFEISESQDEIAWKLYRLYTTYGRNAYTVHFTDRTMMQLVNSGNMRLLPQQVSDSILKYNEHVKMCTASRLDYLDMWKREMDLSVDIFDYKYIRYDISTFKYSEGSYKLITTDPAVLNKYATVLELWKQLIMGYYSHIYYTKVRAVSLIPFLRKEYEIYN
jgi:hypothetical protein